MKNWWWASAVAAVLVSTGLIVGRLMVIPAPAAPPSSAPLAEATWGRVLTRFVNPEGEVDFAALSHDRADLDRYLRFVADTPLDTVVDVHERLAHLINAYNALSMFVVIERGIPKSHAGLNKPINFLLHRLQIGGRLMSLYTFENDVIRPLARGLGDPRVHFALNCSAVSCPVLPRTAFTGTALDQQLQRETLAFFKRPQNLRFDAVTKTLWLSEILMFYSEDFVPAHGRNLIEYTNQYALRAAPPDADICFTTYDWTVADSRRPR